jgi:hypothetical protein
MLYSGSDWTQGFGVSWAESMGGMV